MANYLFANYLLDVDERRLLRDGEEIRLRGKLSDYDTKCINMQTKRILISCGVWQMKEQPCWFAYRRAFEWPGPINPALSVRRPGLGE
jgi:hypothetical protein